MVVGGRIGEVEKGGSRQGSPRMDLAPKTGTGGLATPASIQLLQLALGEGPQLMRICRTGSQGCSNYCPACDME